MLALSPAILRQNRLWLPDLATPTVSAVADSQARAFKRVFAATLTVLRGEQELTQGEIAERVGTSEPTYRRWESVAERDQTIFPDAFEINRLCAILDCEPSELIRPMPPTDRELELARRLGRAARRGGRQAFEDDATPE